MTTFIALFRGINVGGKNPLPMAELKAILTELGLKEVRTYIQSGNVIFRTDGRGKAKLAGSIREAIGEQQGFAPEVLLLTLPELRAAISANPFPEAEGAPKSLHLFFLATTPEEPDLESLDRARSDTERYLLGHRVLYLHAPDGIGRSKLATRVERAIGVSATGRNWRTITRLVSMAEST